MKLRTLTTLIALVGGACLVGCVAEVGQGDDRTGTSRSSLGNDPDPDPDPGDTPGKGASDPGNSTTDDNHGPRPVPWTAGGSSGTSGGTEQKK